MGLFLFDRSGVLSQYNMTDSTLLSAVHAIVNEARSLSEQEAERAMSLILKGDGSPVQIAALLTALRVRGETVEELTGFARAMRAAAQTVDVEGPLLDTCGTGGNSFAAFNVSTTAAFVIAGAGVRVAKHGNRAVSSICGSFDVLEALGVKTDRPADSIRAHGIGFLHAPSFHPAMRHAQPVRLDLKFRTVFNMLGPLANPARANAQVVGTFSVLAAEKLALALAALGLERGFVFHGHDGMGEVTTTASTTVFAIAGGKVTESIREPEDFGVARARREELSGGDASQNAQILRNVLAGVVGPRRDIVLVNAAMGLVAAGAAKDIREGMQIAAHSIDSGKAHSILKAMTK
jgi:anthranilate phosphoribosyltransferase